MGHTLTALACALILAGCAGQDARDRLGIQDSTVLQRGVGTPQTEAAGAVSAQWVSTYASIAGRQDALRTLQQRVDALPDDKQRYFHAKAQCWVDAGLQAWNARDQWGFVEEAIGQAALIATSLEAGTPLSAANPELRTVSTVRPDLWNIVNVIKADPAVVNCPDAQQPLACAEVGLMSAGHEAWTRNFSAAVKALPGIQRSLQQSAQAALQCAAQRPAQVTPTEAQKVTLRADSAFRFNGSNEAAMLPLGKAQLDAVATGLQNNRAIRALNIVGYSDRLGRDAYNQKLSLQRAQTVRDYLRSRGVSVPMTTRGNGNTKPVVDCKQTQREALVQCLAPNRRVEIEFLRDGE
ncbi:MAG: OmpA family protein [Paraburkholderia sp.]|nr:OmpA family protein [Paraburkholderia sp.]MDE1182018.1 OmpA family protein [Paraburkholderia sp.]